MQEKLLLVMLALTSPAVFAHPGHDHADSFMSTVFHTLFGQGNVVGLIFVVAAVVGVTYFMRRN